MSAHTPGPWRVKRSGVICAGPEQELVATCGYRVVASGGEDDANAALIAAAPEMLEALRALIRCVYDSDGACGYKEQWTEERPQIRAARAVIAKAEGKS